MIDRERWSGDVIGDKTITLTWGTHTFESRCQMFADGEGHLTVTAPRSPPLCAREIVGDWLSYGGRHEAAALLLADRWGIDIEEVRR